MASILVVDDDPSILRLVSVLLKAKGHEVTTTTHGVDALDILEERDPDLLILDVNIPDVDGESVCRSARLAGYAHPVVVISAMEHGYDVSREMKADAYLPKPFHPDVLSEHVASLT
jgi:DNA-binding response OmpR family regulator